MRINKALINRAMFLAAVTYQAVQQFENKGLFVLPKGFTLVTTFGGSFCPFLGYILQSKKKIILSFRGTEAVLDVMKDFTFFQDQYPYVPNAGKTHRGFTQIYKKIVRDKVIDTLNKLSPSKKLFITGHSLGGALATLAAIDIAENTEFKEPKLFTFGSPRVGNPAFAAVFNQRVQQSIRISNVNDIVTICPPPKIFGLTYQHVHKKLLISFELFSFLKNHEVVNYYQRLSELNPTFSKKLSKLNPGFCPALTDKG